MLENLFKKSLNAEIFEITDLEKEYKVFYTTLDELHNNPEYKYLSLINLNEIEILKEYIRIPDKELLILDSEKYYVNDHNTLIHTYRKSSEYAFAIALHIEKNKEWTDPYKKELYDDLWKYRITRQKISNKIKIQQKQTPMDTSGLHGKEYILQVRCNESSQEYHKNTNYFYDELFVQKIKLLNKNEEYYFSNYATHSDENIKILNWKDNYALDLLRLPWEYVERKGYYKPHENNLKDIRYEDSTGKYYFQDAEVALNDSSKTNTKIDIASFFGLREKIPSAEQAHIHQLKYSDCIILEGSAGTGKTTTAIEKLAKYYHDGIHTNKFCVITKNFESVQYIKNFINHIGLFGTDIFTLEKFQQLHKLPDVKDKTIFDFSKIICDKYIDLINYLDKNIDFFNNYDHLSQIFDITDQILPDQQISLYIKRYKRELSKEEDEISILMKSHSELITQRNSELGSQSVSDYYNKIAHISKNIQQNIKFINSASDFEKHIHPEIRQFCDEYVSKNIQQNIKFISSASDFEKHIHPKIRQFCASNDITEDQLNKYHKKHVEMNTKDYVVIYLNNLIRYRKIKKKYSDKWLKNFIKEYLDSLKLYKIHKTNEDSIYNLLLSDNLPLINILEELNKIIESTPNFKLFEDYKAKLKKNVDYRNEKIQIIKEINSKINFLNSDKFSSEKIDKIIKLSEQDSELIKQDLGYWKSQNFLLKRKIINNIDAEMEEAVLSFFKQKIKTQEYVHHFVVRELLNISLDISNSTIVIKYINHHFNDNIYHVLVIDEGQDFTYQTIEILRLCTKNLIITGDRLQKISLEGLDRWDQLYDFDRYYSKNIYELTLNFRQTYELANASFNYRKLLQNEKFMDISDSYYSNQKGFEKPRIHIITNIEKYLMIVDEILSSVKEKFTTTFPIVAVYTSDQEIAFYREVFHNRINYAYMEDLNEGIDSFEVILSHIDHIKGKEFPVIISFIGLMTEKMIYLLLSRANFELHMFLNEYEQIPQKLNQLYEHNIIDLAENNI